MSGTTASSSSSSFAADDDDSTAVIRQNESTVAPTTTTTTTPNKKAGSALKSFLSGGIGGACVVLVGHPLDLIKVRMQTTATTESVTSMFMKTFRTSGVAGLYRGVSAPLLAVTPMFAVQFWGYDMGQRFMQWFHNNNINNSRRLGQIDKNNTTTQQQVSLTLTDKCLAGGLSAIPATALMAPSERIKCLMQTSPAGMYRNMLHCATHLYQTGGLASVFRGTGLTLMRDVPGSMAWFGTYEAVKLYLTRLQGRTDPSQLSPVSVLTAGGVAGMACWTVMIPMDVVKSRYQSAPDGMYPGGATDVLTRLLRTEGPSALFTGIKPALLRAFPANAACFFGMEVARQLLSFMD